jgi:hypothetical protein
MNRNQPSTTKTLNPLRGFLSLSLMCGLFSAGCHLGQPSSASFASVTISGKSGPQIRDATIAVFRENGYRAYASGQQLVFEREGSRANTFAYDGLVGAQAGAVTIVRVRAELVELGADSYRLQCQAYMVSDASDSFFEDEHRLTNFRSGPYQHLLNEVAKRLKQP